MAKGLWEGGGRGRLLAWLDSDSQDRPFLSQAVALWVGPSEIEARQGMGNPLSKKGKGGGREVWGFHMLWVWG